jgi:hypothetical protein
MKKKNILFSFIILILMGIIAQVEIMAKTLVFKKILIIKEVV